MSLRFYYGSELKDVYHFECRFLPIILWENSAYIASIGKIEEKQIMNLFLLYLRMRIIIIYDILLIPSVWQSHTALIVI